MSWQVTIEKSRRGLPYVRLYRQGQRAGALIPSKGCQITQEELKQLFQPQQVLSQPPQPTQSQSQGLSARMETLERQVNEILNILKAKQLVTTATIAAATPTSEVCKHFMELKGEVVKCKARDVTVRSDCREFNPGARCLSYEPT